MAGPLMDFAMRNVSQPITGYFPVPLRHGMTVGEVARYINAEYDMGVDLTVVPASGWRREMWFDETGLPWINPSPNIRSLEAALNYPGLVLFEATNLSVGRGTDRPFSVVGAPWLNATAVLRRMKDYDLPGVQLDTVTFVPTGAGYVPFRDEVVHAVQIHVTDRNAYQPVWLALVLLTEIKRLQPSEFRIENDGMTQMLGSRWAREAVERGDDPRAIWDKWQEELDNWSSIRNRYTLYR
jgi:beta-N-acetylhexosaminidase